MKKALVVLTLLALCSFVFAQDAEAPAVKWGAWGRGLFLPAMGGSDTVGNVSESWGANSTRVGINVQGTSENVGFQIDIDTNTGGPVAGDQCKIWAKPIPEVKMQLGRIYDDTFRGSTSFGNQSWLRYSGLLHDGTIFARVGEYGQTNFEVAVTPIDALTVFVGLGGNGLNLMAMTPKTEEIFKNAQVGFGYKIENIGVLRAQYIGRATGVVVTQDTSLDAITDILTGATPGAPCTIVYDTTKTVSTAVPENTYGDINAAFKLTAVPNLTLDVGGFFATDKDEAGYQGKLATGVDYTMDQLTLHAAVHFTLPADGSDYPMEFQVGADYVVDAEQNISISADVMWENEFQSEIADSEISGFFGVTKGLAKGKVGVGVEVTQGTFAGSQPVKDAIDDMTWAIPIKFEYSF